MSSLLIGLIGALIATNPPGAISNLVTQTTGLTVRVPDPNDPVEKEFQKLMEDDDAAHAEVDHWITENEEFAAKGAGLPNREMRRRILKRLAPIGDAYQDFIKRHPDHARVHIAYADFLDGLGDEEGERDQLEQSRALDPTNPAVWNQLANYYGHNGVLTNAFAFYEKAISLNPTEPVYYHNFGTTVYLYRKDAREYYHLEEQQVFDKALMLYSNSMRYDPTNFQLASDVAQSYYGIKPLRTNDALQSWTNALKLADDELEREGVYLHLARIKMSVGNFKEAHLHINAVTNAQYAELKQRLVRNLNEREFGTNTPPPVAATNRVTTPVPLKQFPEKK